MNRTYKILGTWSLFRGMRTAPCCNCCNGCNCGIITKNRETSSIAAFGRIVATAAETSVSAGLRDGAFQAQLADEIQRLPSGAALERAMLDYARLRDQARACAARP